MATSMEPSFSVWKALVLKRLQTRNELESGNFKALLETHNKLFNNLDSVRAQNLQLQIQVEKLRQENSELQIKAQSGIGTGGTKGEKTQALEQKLFRLQEELTDMHRKKGENAQQLIDLSAQLQEKDKELQLKDTRLLESDVKISAYEDELKNLEKALMELQKTNETLKDEQDALQLLYTKTEDTIRRVQEENADLVTRWMQEKAQDAFRMNRENETWLKKKQEEVQKKLVEAAKDIHVEPTHGNPKYLEMSSPANSAICICAVVPDRAISQLDAHDGEVNAVRFCPSGRMFASAGADRKLKLWELTSLTSSCQSRGILMGSNAAVMCIDFDQQEQFVLGASNDYATRVWGAQDHRLRHTLTGHGGKVLAARFLGDSNKVVSGSHDRTLKIWDLRSRACTKTIFAGSSCNDLVTSDGRGTNIISGHFDRKIRFWDTRSGDARANEFELSGKITSLELSTDRQYLLSCSKDDALKLIDVRMNKVVGTFCAEGFKVFLEYTRAALSPDGVYAACGSQDGSIYVWNMQTMKLEKTLKEHSAPVIAVTWHPNGTKMLSCDRNKKVIMWADF
ncbi:autophagy-related protein 16-1-like isoform X2 [Patiria miniata]|uniref:Autophagy-related protein 16 domain-containing protein n=1 Tax=Patiria miniata TaxID=46514 RepID=A0A913ZJ53_PATMI|nr:autophagy-related protein 16-1-like isoform X2 [Patiria miniata]